jgi:hypothetical protein
LPFAVTQNREKREDEHKNNLPFHPCEEIGWHARETERERGVKHTKRPFRIIQVCLSDI